MMAFDVDPNINKRKICVGSFSELSGRPRPYCLNS